MCTLAICWSNNTWPSSFACSTKDLKVMMTRLPVGLGLITCALGGQISRGLHISYCCTSTLLLRAGRGRWTGWWILGSCIKRTIWSYFSNVLAFCNTLSQLLAVISFRTRWWILPTYRAMIMWRLFIFPSSPTSMRTGWKRSSRCWTTPSLVSIKSIRTSRNFSWVISCLWSFSWSFGSTFFLDYVARAPFILGWRRGCWWIPVWYS